MRESGVWSMRRRRAEVVERSQEGRVDDLGELNGKLDAGCERFPLHFSFGTNGITQILEVHKAEAAVDSINNDCEAKRTNIKLTACLL